MPIFDYQCEECGEVFESIEIWKSHIPTECKKCKSLKIHKTFNKGFHVRPDAEVMKHNLPDPVPPLRELIGKNKPGHEGGYRELENDQRELKEYKRTKDKHGNTVWLPKERIYHDTGRK